MANSKKIHFVLPNLAFGGAEHVALRLAKEFKKQGHEVHFVLLEARGELLDEAKNEFKIHNLQSPRIRKALTPLVTHFKGNQIDAVIAFMWPITSICVWAKKISGRQIKLILTDHGVLSNSPQAQGLSGLLMKLSMRLSYPFADSIVGVSQGVTDDILKLSGANKTKAICIHNPAALSTEGIGEVDSRFNKWLNSSNKLLAVGRLKKVKDYPTMLKAMAQIQHKENYHLLILGDGEEKKNLETMIQSLDLQESVTLVGHILDPRPYYKAADLLLLSSKHEGFGNVLIEAMSFGTPVISTDCDFGPREIINNKNLGKLIPIGDSTVLANVIQDHSVANEAELVSRAKNFTPKNIAMKYLGLLD